MTTKPQKIGETMKPTMTLFIRNLWACLLILSSTLAYSKIIAKVDRQVMYLGESLTLVVESDQNTNSQPDFTILDAVFHVGQTGKSSSTQIINGAVTTKTSWQVLLVPKSLGTQIIPPLEVDGERTQAIKIEVNKPDPDAQAGGDIFIEVQSDKTSAYVQEEIQLTVRLLYAINLKNGGLTEPKADGLIVQKTNKDASYTTQRDGKSYQVLEQKYAIFAENSGKLELNPVVFEGEVADNSRRSFGMFQRGRPVRQVSKMLELDIKQIPQAFVNQDWIPAKQVILQQSWSQNKPYQVGEPITRTINFTATGLSETQLPDLDINEIQGAKIYQDKTNTLTRTDGQQLISTKTIKYAVIPNIEGNLEIPEFTLEWFDTNSQSAKTTTIPATTLAIEAAASATTQAPKPIDFNSSPVEPATITSTDITPGANRDQIRLWKTLALVFGLLWLLTAVFLLLKLKGRPTYVIKETQRANPVALKNLNQLSPAQIQTALIAWWNQQYQQHTTNLGQIRDQLAAGEIKTAITELQQQLYGNTTSTQKVNWHQLIKQGHFKPAKPLKVTTAGLPQLYT